MRSPNNPWLAPARGRFVVLQVLPALQTGGVEQGTVEMVQAIVEAGGEALVASEGGRMVRAVERAGGTHITLPLRTKNPWRVLSNAGRLAALIGERGVSVVHARSRAPAWSAYLACRRTGVAFVTTWHGVYSEGLPGKRLYNSVMARGTRVIAISRYVAALIAARHPTARTRLRVVPRGVDPARFDPAQVLPDRLIALHRQWALPDGVPTVVLPGRLTRWKGQMVLVDALARLRHADAVAVLVGDDQGRHLFRRSLGRRARRLGVEARLRLVGNSDDMPAALMLADVVVSASTRPEGFGRVVIEAQAMARMVIATAHGGAAETVGDGLTGWTVPPGDPVALAAAIDRALDLPAEARHALGERARRHVLDTYTTARMQTATLEVYRELIGRDAT